MTQSVLILGASGRFGHNVSEAFQRAGWHVREFDRQHDDLLTAAKGVDVIVVGWNPSYPDWAAQVPALHDRVIKVALETGATVVVPGNVYVYGPGQSPVWSTSTPHLAQNPLGLIRIDMERAYRESGVRTILLRAGDFIDTQASGNWFDMIMTRKIANGIFRYPGRTDVRHAWAFLPDMARAVVKLSEMRQGLNSFEEVAFPGYTLTGHDMHQAIKDVVGSPVVCKPVNWWMFQLLRPFWKTAGCLLEMRYLWDTPHELSAERFNALLPEFEPTPLHSAFAQALPKDIAGKNA